MKKMIYCFLCFNLFLFLSFFLFTCSVFASDYDGFYFNIVPDLGYYYTYDSPNFTGSSRGQDYLYYYSTSNAWYQYDSMDFEKEDALHNGYVFTVDVIDNDVSYTINNGFKFSFENYDIDIPSSVYQEGKGVFTFSFRTINPNSDGLVDEETLNLNLLVGAKFQLTDWASDSSGNTFIDCLSTYSVTDGVTTVSCPTGSDPFHGRYYTATLRFLIDSTPFKGSGLSKQLFVFLENKLYYSELEHAPLTIRHTEDSTGHVQIGVMTNEQGLKDYTWSLDNGLNGSVSATSSVMEWIDLGQLSNGTYEILVSASFENSDTGVSTPYTFTVGKSPLPIADLTGQFNDNDLFLDGSLSRPVSGNSIKKYYFQLDDQQVYSSVSPYYNFLDLDYGSYSVKFYVEDDLGQFSSPIYKTFSYLAPQDPETNFIEDFVNHLGDSFMKLFIPEKDSLRKWFNDTQLMFEKQLGFLSFPFTWTLNFLDRYLDLSDTGHYIISWDNVRVPNFEDFVIIKAGSYDLAVLLENPTLKRLHDLGFIVINALVILAFFKYCSNILARIFGMDEDYYEFISVTDNVVDDGHDNIQRNRVTSSGYRQSKRRRL